MSRKFKRSKKNLKDILFDIYRDLYKNSSPSADFDVLVETAELDEHGRKIIPYDKHFIDKDLSEEIVNKHISMNGLSDREASAIKIESCLGCAPMFKQEK